MKRVKWKGPFINSRSKNPSNILLRNHEITSKLVGSTFNVYTGKKFVKITISNEMISHKAGEFSPTRVRFQFKKKKKK